MSNDDRWKTQTLFFEQNEQLYLLIGREKINNSVQGSDAEIEPPQFFVAITVEKNFLQYFELSEELSVDSKIEGIMKSHVF